jgi:small subunit ribosomal protein S2
MEFEESTIMSEVTMRQLLEAGIHFGHQTRRWNPKMKRYIFGERNGIYIIDLVKTMRQLRKAEAAVIETVSKGQDILFVGSKKQAKDPIIAHAKRCGMYFITQRWLGGTLTNWTTMQQSIKKLKGLEEQEASGKLDELSKREAARIRKEMARMIRNLEGIKDMKRLPGLLFIIDTRKESIAVREAKRLGITTVGVVDTNSDPDTVDIPIPGNDDAIRSVNLFCKAMSDAVIEGRAASEQFQTELAQEAVGSQVIEAVAAEEAAAESGEAAAVGADEKSE